MYVNKTRKWARDQGTNRGTKLLFFDVNSSVFAGSGVTFNRPQLHHLIRISHLALRSGGFFFFRRYGLTVLNEPP